MLIDDLLTDYPHRNEPPDQAYFKVLRDTPIGDLHPELTVLHIILFLRPDLLWFRDRESHLLAEVHRRRIERQAERRPRSVQ